MRTTSAKLFAPPLGLPFVLCAALSLALPTASRAGQTVGLFLNEPGSFNGYTLFAHLVWPTTYLIDNNGLQVNSWTSAYPQGNSAYFLDNGHLLRCSDPGGNPVMMAGGDGGLVEEFDWDGTPVWQFTYSDSMVRHHHDIAPMANGNVLILAWEYKSGTEAIAAGRNPALLTSGSLWPEHVVEVEPSGMFGGNIVWEWHLWDHVVQDFDSTRANWGVIADHPELVDINFASSGSPDWIHANAIDYNETLDQIIISSPRLHEFWIIDHGTTTGEAAGHTGGARGRGGDILYRWGNPQGYDAGTEGDRKLFGQHDVEWIDPGLPGAGNILVYNNGNGRPAGAFSTIEEITPSDVNGNYPMPASGVPHGPAAPTWTFTDDPPGDFYSSFISGAQRQPNGNTLICEGATGTFFEIDSNEDDVWLYVSPLIAGGPVEQGDPIFGNTVFRADRYGPSFTGFDGRDLTPGAPVETYMTGVEVVAGLAHFKLAQNYPNPFHPSTTIGFSLGSAAHVSLDVYDVAGRHIATLVDGRLGSGDHRVPWKADRLASGVYHYRLRVDSEVATKRMVLLR